MTGNGREHVTDSVRLEKLQQISEDYTAALAMLSSIAPQPITLPGRDDFAAAAQGRLSNSSAATRGTA